MLQNLCRCSVIQTRCDTWRSCQCGITISIFHSVAHVLSFFLLSFFLLSFFFFLSFIFSCNTRALLCSECKTFLRSGVFRVSEIMRSHSLIVVVYETFHPSGTLWLVPPVPPLTLLQIKSRCHVRTFLSKWFHKEPLTSEEPFCLQKVIFGQRRFFRL